MRGTIGIDVDSVLNNLCVVWLDRYNVDYGDCLTPADITGWDTHVFVKPECGKKIYDYLTPDLTLACAVENGAQEAVEWLIQQGYDLYAVTASPICAYTAKGEWLHKYFPMIPHKHHVIMHAKHLLRLDYLIDDGLHNFDGFTGQGIVFDQPWNRVTNRQDLVRVHGWSEVIDYFKEIHEEGLYRAMKEFEASIAAGFVEMRKNKRYT